MRQGVDRFTSIPPPLLLLYTSFTPRLHLITPPLHLHYTSFTLRLRLVHTLPSSFQPFYTSFTPPFTPAQALRGPVQPADRGHQEQHGVGGLYTWFTPSLHLPYTYPGEVPDPAGGGRKGADPSLRPFTSAIYTVLQLREASSPAAPQNPSSCRTLAAPDIKQV
jgi:hypothetical protein